MRYTVNRDSKGKIEVKVDVFKSAFEKSYENTLAALSKSVDISGFRLGMAPSETVEKHVGISKVLNETASFLVNKHLSEIFEKEKFFPIDSPKIAIGILAQNSPFSFVAAFTQKPEVKVGDWQKIKIKKIPAKQITENDVGESIKNIFEAWSKQQETKNEKQETEGEQKEETGKFIYDAHGNRIPIRTEESSSSAKATEDKKVDDDFARAIGARDLAHLKELVKRDLETIVADQVEAKFEQELFEKILLVSELEVPDVLVDDELNRILVRLSTELEKQGSDLDKYLAEQKTTIDELKAKWRPQAEKNVKITLVMDEIGRNQEVKVAKEELETALKGVSQTNLSSEQRADLERYLALSIFQAKTLDLVKKTVTLTA